MPRVRGMLMKLFNLHRRFIESEIEDIDKNLEILRKKNLSAKIHSFLTHPFLFGNVEKHIELLEKRKEQLLKELELEKTPNWADYIIIAITVFNVILILFR